jgi:hypothetical protein
MPNRNPPTTRSPRPALATASAAKPPGQSSSLWKHVGELATSSALLLFLSSVATDRLSLTQATFFLLAAAADAAGKPATRTELIEAHFEGGRASIRNSYRQLLEPSRVYPTALGWLRTEEDPHDARQQTLKLTEEGRKIIDGVLLTLEPIVKGPPLPTSLPN